jgi:hypothetical protein
MAIGGGALDRPRTLPLDASSNDLRRATFSTVVEASSSLRTLTRPENVAWVGIARGNPPRQPAAMSSQTAASSKVVCEYGSIAGIARQFSHA